MQRARVKPVSLVVVSFQVQITCVVLAVVVVHDRSVGPASSGEALTGVRPALSQITVATGFLMA